MTVCGREEAYTTFPPALSVIRVPRIFLLHSSAACTSRALNVCDCNETGGSAYGANSH